MSNETPPAVPVVANFSGKPTAPAGDRIIAALLDGLIIFAFYIPCFIPLLGCIWMPVALTIAIAYPFVKDTLPWQLNGQSIGKRIMKIRVVTESGDALTGNWGAGVIRQVVFFIPAFPFVELVILLTSKDVRRLGDQWAKTKVVKVG